uniref:Uncharacterized protein n=1 Tax=Arundo donax TaxID=35708 RepID=A0A0A9GRM3_ARUDO
MEINKGEANKERERRSKKKNLLRVHTCVA